MSYSDYLKDQLKIIDLLPDVYKSDTNTILSNMVFDRHLSKDDTVRVSGFIGKGNSNAIINRQISEQTPHRQAFQLAPTMYTKVGDVETTLSYKAFQTQLELMGININNIQKWGNSIEFNWIPPINLDMLINYRNYFWEAESSIDSPQYFTIENKCIKSFFRVNAYNNLIKQRGPQYTLLSIDHALNTFTIGGNHTSEFSINSIFYTSISDNINLENRTWVARNVSYDYSTDTTIITTDDVAYKGLVPPANPTIGMWWYNSTTGELKVWTSTVWSLTSTTDTIVAQISTPAIFDVVRVDFVTNSMVIEGKQDDIFIEDFVFFTKNNTTLPTKFWTTVTSSYDDVNEQTSIKVLEQIAIVSNTTPSTTVQDQLWFKPSNSTLYKWNGTNWLTIPNIITANISLLEALSIYQGSSNSICNLNNGWDMGLWDDNDPIPGIVWNQELLLNITHDNESDWLAVNTLEIGAIWYNQSEDQLYQYGDLIHPDPSDSLHSPIWNPTIGNFSAILSQTHGLTGFDHTSETTPQKFNEWSSNNRWVHKTGIHTAIGVRRAQVPILEYNSTTELNDWTKVNYVWKYRADPTAAFIETDTIPLQIELEPIKHYVAKAIGGSWYIYLFNKNSDVIIDSNYTDVFAPNYPVIITNPAGYSDQYTVDFSEFRFTNTSDPIEVQGSYVVTVIKLKETIFNSPLIGDGTDYYHIIPNTTSKGDVWRGYHVHWCLDVASTTYQPSSPQKINLQAYNDTINSITTNVVGNPDFVDFIPQVSTITYGNTFQEFVVDVDNVANITLMDQFKYDPLQSRTFATPYSNELRVYVNNVRQYGTYTETIAYGTPHYTMIHDNSGNVQFNQSIQIPYVTDIFFDSSYIQKGDVIRIEIGPAAFTDMGFNAIPVRTEEDDALFAALINTSDQPTYMSLTQYHKTEQTKTKANQYPLFNVYDVLTGEVTKASPIFAFVEDSDAPIDVNTSKRLYVGDTGSDYRFIQYLLEEDNGRLYCYRHLDQVEDGTYWYSPLTNKLQYWDGYAWSSNITISTVSGLIVRIPIISETDPIEYWNVDNTIWYNSLTSKLYIRNVSSNSWVILGDVIVNGSDPTFQSIWKPGLNNEEYIPKYVDKDNNEIAIGSELGDWEVLYQWKHNPEHDNRSIVKYSQLVPHFGSILENQPNVPGLLGGGVYAYTQDEYKYNVGGTIKEFNYSFDTLISAVNVTNVTPIRIIEFAVSEYTSELYQIREIFNDSAAAMMASIDSTGVVDISTAMIDDIISLYENNDFSTRLYKDTSAYDQTTGIGIKNWIATAPMFGFVPRHKPTIAIDGDTVHIQHHDGHRSIVDYNAAEQITFVKKLVSQIDTRTNSTMGLISSSVPPSTPTEYQQTFGITVLLSGLYWYTTGTSPQLYRLELYTSSSVHPSIYYAGGELPDGVNYYNTSDHRVYEKIGNTWQVLSDVDDISILWKPINIQQLIGNILLEVENRLYDVTGNINQRFDYDTLIQSTSDQVDLNNAFYDRFYKFVVDHGITLPFVNYQYSAANPNTWNYVYSVIDTKPTPNKEVESVSYWESLYNNWYNTPYPHLEPWKLQGYLDKPNWWDDEYLQTNDSSRRWKYNHSTQTGMWENIRVGIIPAGRTYPSGIISSGNPTQDNENIPTYNFFSVNIGDSQISGGYNPDDILPPYYDNSALSLVDQDIIRSLFVDYSQIVSPDADYVFGLDGPIEWLWKVSSQYQYDKLIVAFLLQPAKALHYMFGPTFTDVNSLQVEDLFGQVYSHKRTLFHGDIYDTSKVYKIKGLNQWYINFNRYTGYDNNGQFRQMWENWSPKLTYQSDGIIDTESMSVYSTTFPIVESDYNVLLTNIGPFKDIWLDAFNVKVINMPPSIRQYNNQSQWRFELSSLANISRTIEYYDVKSYQFMVDSLTDVCSANRYCIVDIQDDANRIFVSGDQTRTFVGNSYVKIDNSQNNNGTYTVLSSVYEAGSNRTRINLVQPVDGSTVDGCIGLAIFSIPWETGDMVVLSSTKHLPYPLVANTPYYIVRDSSMEPNEFKLAETLNESLSNVTIDITNSGVGDLVISEISTSFNVLGGIGNSKDTWYHMAIDKTVKRTLDIPTTLVGVQNLINLIDGISAVYQDNGIIIDSADSSDFDPIYGRLIDWSFETERFIDWAFGLRAANVQINDRYEFSVNTVDNTITILDNMPNWLTGQQVMVMAIGTLPMPMQANVPYYLIQTSTVGTYQLSLSSNPDDINMILNIETVGSGNLYISIYNRRTNYPQFEINPFRNNVWIDTPQGILSNIIEGPYSDIRVQQTIFDQYGRKLDSSKLNVYRQDKRSNINIRPNIANDYDRFFQNDPYHYIHIGGAHLFIEGYEHYIIFNDYTIGENLLYDPFLGLNVTKIEIDYLEKSEYSMRPTLGGYYLIDGKFNRNIEGTATDLTNYYDVSSTSFSNITKDRATHLLGYSGRQAFLDLLNVNSNSQFLFHRGLINTKGSSSSVEAYINSKRFVDAKVDEFWAYKIAEFGDNRPKIYPELKLFSSDGIVDDIRFEFIDSNENIYGPDVITALNQGFKIISFDDTSRWNRYPEQRAEISSPIFLEAEISSKSTIFVNPYPPPLSKSGSFTHWYNSDNGRLYIWNGFSWVEEVYNTITTTPDYIYWKHDQICDDIRVVRDELSNENVLLGIESIDVSHQAFIILENYSNRIYSGMVFTVVGSTSNDGEYQVIKSVYIATNNTTIIYVATPINSSISDGQININLIDFDSYNTVPLASGTLNQYSYYRLNAEVVKFTVDAFVNVLHIYTINPSRNKISPIKLIDTKSNTVVENIPLWHPALGYHYHVAEHNIDVQHNMDPALYNVTLNPSDKSQRMWDEEEIGRVWLDTSSLGYVPYYDTTVYSNINTRLSDWGKLAEYGEARVFKWTESSVAPSEWSNLVVTQLNDSSIPQNEKVTGNVRTNFFTNTRQLLYGTANLETSVIKLDSEVVHQSDALIFSVNAQLPDPIETSTAYYVETEGTNLTEFTVSDINGQQVEFDSKSQLVEIVPIVTGVSSIPPTSGYQLINFSKVMELTDITGLVDASGYQTIRFNPGKVGTDSTGLLNDSTIYTATITINSISSNVAIIGSDAQTFGELVAELQYQLGTPATVELVNGNIIITSTSTGSSSTVSILDTGLFDALTDLASIDTPIDGYPLVYSATIVINGITNNISVIGGNSNTFAELVSEINNDLTGATIDLVNGNLVVTSELTGIASTVLIVDGNLFQTLNHYSNIGVAKLGVGSIYGDKIEYVMQTNTGLFQNGDIVKFTTTGEYPNGVEIDTEYIIADLQLDTTQSYDQFKLTDLLGGDIEIASNIINTNIPAIGKGKLTAHLIKQRIILAPSFVSDNWSKRPFARVHLPAVTLITETYNPGISFPIQDPIIHWIKTDVDFVWHDGEIVDVYSNGSLVYTGEIQTTDGRNIIIDTTGSNFTVFENEVFDIVRSFNSITPEDLSFNPTVYDDGTQTTWWKEDYEYTVIARPQPNEKIIPKYYFWVEQSTNVPSGNDKMSTYVIANSIKDIPIPHCIVQRPVEKVDSNPFNSFTINYREAIIRRIAQYVSSNDRFLIRFTKDLTLRDDLQADSHNINLKSVHEEWLLFRKEQAFNISIDLWNKLVESLAGESLTENSTGSLYPVPSLDRVLYDQLNDTDTRYGLGVDQTFVDRDLGLATVLYYLNDITIDFSPVNIQEFLSTYTFDTPDNIKTAMSVIYNTFGYTHVNRIWFNVLYDALSTRTKYKELIKTSWIAIHGIQVLGVNGIFDD